MWKLQFELIQIAMQEMLQAVSINTSLTNHQCEKCSLTDCFFNSVDLKTWLESVIGFNLVYSCRKKVQLQISILQGIHDKCWSKQLIQILSKLEWFISYDELDCSLAKEIMDSCLKNKVPLPQITSFSIIQGAIDNFDHNEITFTGNGSSHDTILMVFQNSKHSTETDVLQKSGNCTLERNWSFKFDLHCQIILTSQKLARGKIPDNFKLGTLNVPENVEDSVTEDVKLYILARHKIMILTNEIKAPSFRAKYSRMDQVKFVKTAFKKFEVIWSA